MRALLAVSLLLLSFAVTRGLLSNIQMRRYDPWFKTTFGFREPKHYDQVQDAFRVEKDDATGDITLHTVPSNDNQSQSFFVGRFETPSVGELRDRLTNEQQRSTSDSKTQQCLHSTGLAFRHIVADVGMLHRQCPGDCLSGGQSVQLSGNDEPPRHSRPRDNRLQIRSYPRPDLRTRLSCCNVISKLLCE